MVDMDQLLAIWKKTCEARAFELNVIRAHKAKKLAPAPFYLSVGQEHISAIASEIFGDWALFPQHRCHSWYLSFGGDPGKLIDELMGLPTGCAGGMGGSASLHSPENKIFGHSGLLGDQIPIATGYALGKQKPTIVVLGDAAAEEDYALASMGFAVSKRLPILYLVEDNNLSILTKVEVRRKWGIVDAARGIGLRAIDLRDDALMLRNTFDNLCSMSQALPALINIRTCRHHWHAGPGQDGPPEWNAYEDFRRALSLRGIDEIQTIEQTAIAKITKLWDEKLG